MSKSYRSWLLTGAILATVAACGDDVTVIGPPGGGINSVTVAPDGVTIPVQGTVQMIAAVNADSGVATTVTWNTSNANVASVSATGLVTGVAPGTVGITACSTVNTSACGAATITVAAPVPATISIQSVTSGGLGTPVNINNISGQIDVSLNFEPGSTPATEVQLLLDDVVVASQGFSALEWSALVANAVEEGGELAKVVIVLSINTADFDPATGVAKYFNGPRQLKAAAVLQGGTQVATPSQTLVFNNQSGFLATLSTDNGADPSSAINPGTGLQWLGGNVIINLVGVSYVQGQTIASVGFTVLGKTRVAALTNGVATLNWSEGTTWSAGNTGVGNYMSPAAGETFTGGSAVFSGGQTVVVSDPDDIFLNGTNATPPLQTIRLDNVAPGADPANADPQPVLALGALTTTWAASATAFGPGTFGVPSQTALNATDEGVDAVTVEFFASEANAALPGTAAACSLTGLTAVTTGANLTESDAIVFAIRVVVKDALGNRTCLDLPSLIGADFTAPEGEIVAGPDDETGFDAPPPDFSVSVSDNASGFGATPLRVNMSRVNPSGTTSCVINTGASSCTGGSTAAQPLDFEATPADAQGYYTVSITLVDQAGNTTVLVTDLVYLLDTEDPGFTGGISLPSLIAGAATNTFGATVTDNIDLNEIFGDVTYPLATLRYPSQSVGSFGTPLEKSATVSYAVSNWIRCLNAATDFSPAGGQPTDITLTVSDQANNTTTLASPAFGANAQTCTGDVGNIAEADITSFVDAAPNYGAGKVKVDIDGADLDTDASASVTLTATAVVTVNLANPFTRVDFYYEDGGVLIRIGTATVTQAQTQTERTFTYRFVWNPDASVPVGSVDVFAIGVDAQGDAVFASDLGQAVTTVP